MASRAEFDTPVRAALVTASNASAVEASGSRAKTVSAVTLLTLVVALLGYVREATLAARFGVSATMDAYFGAIFIPINLHLILVVGTVSPILIPILLREDDSGHARTSESFSITTNFVLVLFLAVVICGMWTAHWWLSWLFPGFQPGTQALALRLIYIIFPGVPLLALAGILTAALNGFHKYSLAAFTPSLLNISIIGVALVAHGEGAIFLVGLGTTLGFLLQFLILVPAVRALGIRYMPILRFNHPAVLRLLKLGSPLLLYLIVASACPIIERNLASRLSPGALSSITYATRLFTLPSNFLAAPLVLVAYPYFARAALRGNYSELREDLARTVRLLLFLFIPITVWLALNAVPITRAVYERGHFDLTDSLHVARVFQFYSIGILPNAITVLLLRCFYAIQDTLTPLWAETIDLVFFVICAPLLTGRFGISGLAFTRGMTFVLVAAILVLVLWRRRNLLALNRGLLTFCTKTTVVTLGMAIVSMLGMHLLRPWFTHAPTLVQTGLVCSRLLLDAVIFLSLAMLLKIPEAEKILLAACEFLQHMRANLPKACA